MPVGVGFRSLIGQLTKTKNPRSDIRYASPGVWPCRAISFNSLMLLVLKMSPPQTCILPYLTPQHFLQESTHIGYQLREIAQLLIADPTSNLVIAYFAMIPWGPYPGTLELDGEGSISIHTNLNSNLS